MPFTQSPKHSGLPVATIAATDPLNIENMTNVHGEQCKRDGKSRLARLQEWTPSSLAILYSEIASGLQEISWMLGSCFSRSHQQPDLVVVLDVRPH